MHANIITQVRLPLIIEHWAIVNMMLFHKAWWAFRWESWRFAVAKLAVLAQNIDHESKCSSVYK